MSDHQFDPSICEGCLIQGEYVPVRPTGNPDAPYLIVTDKPSEKSAREGVALARGHNDMLMKHFNKEDFVQQDFRYHPMCLCPYKKDVYPNKELKKIHQHCRPHLEDYIEATQPEAIVTLGAEPTSQVFGKATKITKVRGLGHNSLEFGTIVFPIQHPSLACMYVQNEPILAADIASFGRLVDAGMDTKVADSFTTGEYKLVDDLQFLIDRDPELISFDTETTGLRWYKKGVDVRTYNAAVHLDNEAFSPKFQILTMQFCTGPGEGYAISWDHPENPMPANKRAKIRNQIRKLLCKPDRIVVGQNLKFDQMALWATEGITFRIGGDTEMLAAIYDENLPEKNLDVLTKLFVPEMAGYADRFNATVNKAKMWQSPLGSIVQYGCGDVDAAYRVYEVLEEEVAKDAGNWNHYVRVSLPGLNAFGGIEQRGMYVDDEVALPEFQAYMQQEVDTQRRSLLAQVHKDIKRDHINIKRLEGQPIEKVLSFSRQEFLKDILFLHPKGLRLTPKVFTKTTANLPDHLKEPSTSSKDHLPYFFEKYPFTQELANYVKDERLLSTNVIGFRENFVFDGKVRPTYSLTKAVTRRTASRDPNGQNFPKRGEKAKKYQRIFKSRPGYYVISRDLSQAELRIAGEMACDPVITRIYQEDGDIHVSTACIVMGVTEAQFARLAKTTQKDARQKAKAVNFGFIYGMGWRKFIGYAKTQYGVTFTEKEAQRIRNAYFDKYKGLKRWHDNTRAYVQKHGMVRSISGLVRHLPQVRSPEEYIQQEAIRQAINSPVQEFGSTLGVIALGRMHQEVDPEYLEIIGFIHDAIYAYVKCEYLEWGLKTLGYYMESTPIQEWFNYRMNIPIKSDPSFGLNMGDVFELDDFPRDDTPYDWSHECLMNKEGTELLIEVPAQETPPNNGRRVGSPYTLDTDLEPEGRVVRRTRSTESTEEIVEAREVSPKVTKIVRRTRPAAAEEPEAKPRRIVRRR